MWPSRRGHLAPEFEALGVMVRDSVHADVRTANVFVGDFSI